MNVTINDTELALQLEILKRKIFACLHENNTHSFYDLPPSKALDTIEDGLFCPKVYDGILCWDDTPAGATAYQNCPDNIEGFNPAQMAHKVCLLDGVWYKHDESNLTWTNYTTCIDYADYAFRVMVTDLSIAGYSLSAFCLSVTIFVYWYFGLISCTRTKVHFQLFLSLAMSSIWWIVYYTALVKSTLHIENPALCHAIYAVNVYFMVASYFWMFCESVHIYRSLIPILGEEFGLPLYTWYMLASWGTPLFLTFTHFMLRRSYGDGNRCLIESSTANYVLSVPALSFFVISLYFFFCILHVIYKKARHAPGEDGVRPVSAASPACKSATVLFLCVLPGCFVILLFGLHFLIMPVQPLVGTDAEKIYAFCCGVITSNQGTFIAVILCLFSEEVRTKVRTAYRRRVQLRQDLQQITGVTGGESVQVADTAL